MFTDEELSKLEEAIRTLRRIIINKDESETERNISGALVYLDCARQNAQLEKRGSKPYYKISPQVVVSHE